MQMAKNAKSANMVEPDEAIVNDFEFVLPFSKISRVPLGKHKFELPLITW